MVWQHLVSSWLKGYATDQVYRAAAEKVKASAGEHSAADSQEPPLVDVAVIASNTAEAGELTDRLSDAVTVHGDHFKVHLGLLHERRIALVEAGGNAAAAAQATTAVLAAHRPAWVIAAGFAISNSDEVKACDVVLADALLDRSGHRLRIDMHVDPESLKANPRIHLGTVLSDSIETQGDMAAPKTQTASSESPAALCSDITSFAVAEACRKYKTPCLVVRVVTQTPADETSADIKHLHNQSTVAGKLGAATGALWRRPSSIKDMWNDKERAILGAGRLATYLAGMVAQLPARDQDNRVDNE